MGRELGEPVDPIVTGRRAGQFWSVDPLDPPLLVVLWGTDHEMGRAEVEALEFGLPDRVGHGVDAFDDPSLVSLLRERQIHSEMCPTSNLKTGAVARLEGHPLPRVLAAGLNVGINTDDPGPFECSMNSEFEVAAGVLGLTEADLRTLTANAWNARFGR